MTWNQTYTGKKFNLLNPTPEMVCIEDIAHHLSQLCRFTGASKRFYSVAEHSILVSYLVPSEAALYGLLHDAHEAYVGDASNPLKRAMRLRHKRSDSDLVVGHYDWISGSAMGVVSERFGLGLSEDPLWGLVKKVDLRMLMTEAKQLLDSPPEDWGIDAEPYSGEELCRLNSKATGFHFLCLGGMRILPEEWEQKFLARFEELKGEP